MQSSLPSILLSVSLFSASLMSTGLQAQTRVYLYRGSQAQDRAGTAVAPLGDINGDGVGDFLYGIPGRTRTLHQEGELRAVSGRTGLVLYSITGRHAGRRLGSVLAPLGDLDHDGVTDFLAGCPADDSQGTAESGFGICISGRNARIMWTAHARVAGSRFGASAVRVPDMNGDLFPDIAVGAPTPGGQGRVHIVSGLDGSEITSVVDSAQGTRFGEAVLTVPDLDGDRREELVIGRPRGGTTGGISVYSSVAPSLRFLHTSSFPVGSHMGGTMALIPDQNGDRYPELLLGSSLDGFSSAPVFIVNGWQLRSGAYVLHTMTGRSGSMFGAVVASLEDVNGDGVRDFAIGAPEDGLTSAGRVFVYSGTDRRQIWSLPGGAGDRCGSAIAGLADLNGDGRGEVAVGFPTDSVGAAETGRLEIYSTDLLGSFSNYGAGCPGSNGTPGLRAGRRPVLGQQFFCTADRLRAGTTGLWLFGASTNVDLTAIGMPGCLQLVTPAIVAPLQVQPTGAIFAVTIPRDPGLLGRPLAMQAFALDPGVNALGGTTTDGLLLVAGNQ